MKHSEIRERNKRIVNRALEGKTVEEIAKMENLSEIRISQILHSFNVKAKRKSNLFHGETSKFILSEIKKGTKLIEIAKMAGVSRQYVSQVNKKYNEINTGN